MIFFYLFKILLNKFLFRESKVFDDILFTQTTASDRKFTLLSLKSNN